jgi:hypothetical protein
VESEQIGLGRIRVHVDVVNDRLRFVVDQIERTGFLRIFNFKIHNIRIKLN